MAKTTKVATQEAEHHGLTFLNNDWNKTITNGEPIVLKWNETLDVSSTRLGVYSVSFPKEGEISYHLERNLTDIVLERSAEWTPEDLSSRVYTLWLESIGQTGHRWAFSPIWQPSGPPTHQFHWAAPVGIPIIVLLSLYGIALSICLLYRRKRKRREKVESEPPKQRNESITSVFTVQTLEDEDGMEKPGVWLFSRAPRKTSMDDLETRNASVEYPSLQTDIRWADTGFDGRRPSASVENPLTGLRRGTGEYSRAESPLGTRSPRSPRSAGTIQG